MKAQKSSIGVWKTLIVAVAVLAVVGAAGVVQAATVPNQITVHNQDLNSGVIMLDSVTAAQDGWVVVYMDPNNLTAGEIVGYAPVKAGTNKDVKVTIDTAKVGDAPTLWAVLHVDNDVKSAFEWGWKGQSYNDQPVVENGHNVVAAFGTAADQGPAPSATSAAPVAAAPVAAVPVAAVPVATKAPVSTKPAANTSSIAAKNQDLNSGVIMIDSVTAPQNGWVVVYKNPNLTAGEIVGYAPVHQGTNTDVKVTINTAKVGDLPTLWAALHADNGIPGLFEWGTNGRSYDDQPIFENGHDIVAAFGTAADQ